MPEKPDSSVVISTRLRDGQPGFDSQQEDVFPFSMASEPALGSTVSPIQWVPGGGGLSFGVKRQGREADS
jgi:hypothetical protein